MATWIVRIFVILTIGCALGDKMRYDDYKLYEIFWEQEYHPDVQRELAHHIILDHDFFHKNTLNVLVEPNASKEFATLLASKNIPHEIMDVNIQQLIDDESKNIKPFNGSAKGSDFGWKNYHVLETIYMWLDHLTSQYPNIRIFNLGLSHENRTIKGVIIAHNKSNPYVFVEAGIHGMEWIGPAAATYLIQQLIHPREHSSHTRFLSTFLNWIIVPIANPDGYKYTFDKDRLWRKNRQRFQHCFGVDLNRNFETSWSYEYADSCSSTYPGPRPFSAPESDHISTFLKAKRFNVEAYLSFHSASQKILYPNANRPKNVDDFQKIGEKAAKTLEKLYGKRFDVGIYHDHLGRAAGTSIDYAYYKLQIPLVLHFDLRRSTNFTKDPAQSRSPARRSTHDTKEPDLFLPANQIEDASREAFVAVSEALFSPYEIYHPLDTIAEPEGPLFGIEDKTAFGFCVFLLIFGISVYCVFCFVVKFNGRTICERIGTCCDRCCCDRWCTDAPQPAREEENVGEDEGEEDINPAPPDVEDPHQLAIDNNPAPPDNIPLQNLNIQGPSVNSNPDAPDNAANRQSIIHESSV